MILFPERPFTTPFLYRFFEGLTSFSMSIGFLVGGGQIRSSLFFFYLLYSLASFSFHLFPSELTYFLDISMIDLLTMERGYTTSHNLWIYPFYIAMMLAEKKKTQWGLMIRVGLVLIFTSIKSIYYICFWFISLLTFLQVCRYTLKKDVFRTTLTCCLFHLYIGCVSYMETTHYNFDYKQHRIEKLLRYYFFLVFVFHTSTLITDNKHHVNCVLTFITSVVLTPFALYETWVQCKTPSFQHMDALQEDMVLYHIYLPVTSALEVAMYVKEITNTSDGFLRYCAYFLFLSFVMTRMTQNPKRLRSILSLTTALVLSPLSFIEIYREVFFGESGGEEIQYFMSHFYMAYVVVDLSIGMIYYPEYFTFLEGWLHHIGTFLFVYYGYYVDPMKRTRVCVQLVVETPSIILFLSRIFYDVPWIQKMKKLFFYPSFFFFRIVVPTFVAVYLHLLCDVCDYLIFGSFTLLNLHWLIKMWR